MRVDVAPVLLGEDRGDKSYARRCAREGAGRDLDVLHHRCRRESGQVPHGVTHWLLRPHLSPGGEFVMPD